MIGVSLAVTEQYPVLHIEPALGRDQMVLLSEAQIARYQAAWEEWRAVQRMLIDIDNAQQRAQSVAQRRAHRAAALAKNRQRKQAYNAMKEFA
jgi:hypothetical protein